MSRVLEDGVDGRHASPERGVPGSRSDIVTAFWMATAGGAAAVDLPVGLLETGRRFDAFVVDTAAEHGSVRVWPGLDDPRLVFEKIVRLVGPGDITSTWVDGRLVSGSRPMA
jgi:guanine deaminase